MLVREYRDTLDKQFEEYKNSDAYKEDKKKEAAEVSLCQKKVDKLIIDLYSIDFNNNIRILDWLCEMHTNGDRVGVNVNKDEIISIFKENGFVGNMNTGDDFDEENEASYAGWLIGQALSGLESYGSVHQIIHHFTKKFKELFNN